MSIAGIRKFLIPEILFGSGSRKLAGQYAKNMGAHKALLVTDEGVKSAGWLKDVENSLDEYGISYALFENLSPNPRDYEVMAGAEIYEREKCNAIISIGGGSPTDCAKGIGIVTTNKKKILDFVGVDKIDIPMPPLICIPTTAGASSDVSQFTIILDSAEKVKTAIISRAIVPDVSLVDPDTTTSMDNYLTVTTGIDALVHAIEAFVSKGSSSLTDVHALEAIRLIARYLPIRLKEPSNTEAAEKMMLASMEAGLAFSNAILGAVHAMAHSLGGFLDLPHGECNAILIDHVINYNYGSVPEKYDAIANAFGIVYKNETSSQKKKILLSRIADFKTELGVTKTLKSAGVKSSDIPILAAKAYNDPCLLTNPKEAKEADLEAIYEEAM